MILHPCSYQREIYENIQPDQANYNQADCQTGESDQLLRIVPIMAISICKTRAHLACTVVQPNSLHIVTQEAMCTCSNSRRRDLTHRHVHAGLGLKPNLVTACD